MSSVIATLEAELDEKSLAKLKAEEELGTNEKIIRKICAVARSKRSKGGFQDQAEERIGRQELFVSLFTMLEITITY
jgi:hypothetical protein